MRNLSVARVLFKKHKHERNRKDEDETEEIFEGGERSAWVHALSSASCRGGGWGGACCERNVDAPYFWQEADAEGRFSALALSTLMRKVLAAYAEVRAGVESRS